MSLLNKLTKSLFLLFSIVALDANAGNCDGNDISLVSVQSNGDGTFTYEFSVCMATGTNPSNNPHHNEGFVMVFYPSSVDVITSTPSKLASVPSNSSDEDYLNMFLGNDISHYYPYNEFSSWTGMDNAVSYEYQWPGIYDYFNEGKGIRLVCFPDNIFVTTSEAITSFGYNMVNNQNSITCGPGTDLGNAIDVTVPCTISDQEALMCEGSAWTYGEFDFTNDLAMGQSSLANLTFEYDNEPGTFLTPSAFGATQVDIPDGQESITFTVVDEGCDDSEATLTLKRDGPELVNLVDTIITCDDGISLSDYNNLFITGSPSDYTAFTWYEDQNAESGPNRSTAASLGAYYSDPDDIGYMEFNGVYLHANANSDQYRVFWIEIWDNALCSKFAMLYVKEGDGEFTVNSPVSITECTTNGSTSFSLIEAQSMITNQGSNFSWYSDYDGVNLSGSISGTSYTGVNDEYLYVDITSDNGCPNVVAELNLSISNAVAEPIIPNPFESCGGNGVDLTLFENTIDPTGLLDISWSDDNGIILSPDNYGLTGNVTANVSDVSGECTDQTSLDIVAGNVSGRSVELSFCPNDNGEIEINLNDYADTVIIEGYIDHWENALGNSISEDYVTNQSQSVLTAIITDGNCFGQALLTLNIGSGPSLNSLEKEVCANSFGEAEFDLVSYQNEISSISGLSFSFFEDNSFFFPVLNPASYSITEETIIYVQVISSDGCESQSEIVLKPSPVISQSTERILCDNDNNGEVTFDLDALKNTVTGGNLQYNVTWFTDTIDAASTIFFPGSYLSEGEEEVFANVEHPTLGCSAWATVLLSIGNIEARDTAISTCDYNDGQVLIDLTNANAAINNGTNNSVDYYNDPGLTLAVSDPSAYVLNNGIDTVYAQVVFGDCESIARVFLSAVSAPVLYNGIIDACNEGSQTGIFDLSATETDITAGQVYENGRFTTDASGNDLIFFTSSYSSSSSTIYYHTDNQGCASIATVDLQVNGLDVINSFLTSCEDSDGKGLYDLSSITTTVTNGNGYDVTWFGDVALSNPITNSNSYLTDSSVAFAKISFGNCADTMIFVELFLEDIEASSTSLQGCGLNGNGFFDLSLAEAFIKNSPSNNLTFYFDETRINEISPNAYIDYIGIDGSRVFATISDDAGCSDTASVLLNVNELPNVSSDNPTLFGCDYSQNGTGLFNILDVENTVTGGQGGYTFLYYLDENSTDEIQGNLEEYISTSSTIFFVISDGLCENNGNITLNVANAPAANPVIIDGCDGDLDNIALFDLSGAESKINTNSNLDFIWSNETGSLSGDLSSFESGSGNLSIQVLEPSTGCSTITSATLTLNQDVPNIFFKSNCLDNKTQFVYSSAGSFENAIWTFEENQTALGTLVSYEFTSEDIYTVTVSGNSGNCNFEASTEVEINSFTVQGMEDQTIFEGESVNLFTDLSDDETIIHSWIGDYLDDPNSNNPVASPQILEGNNIFSYTVEVMNGDSCLASAGFFIEVDAERNSGTSTIFTPNDDGENDVFKIEGSGICDIDLNIFNRWGQVVFHGENPGDGWDGTVNGKKQPIDGYAFTAKIIYCNEEEETMNGFITLIR